MEKEKKGNNKKLLFTVIVCVTLVGLFILLNTYAFWRVKGNQSDSNYVVGACLEFSFVEEKDQENHDIGGFVLDGESGWPMSDEEGIHTPGYSFIIKNSCSTPVNYQVVLESLTVPNKTNSDYFADNMIKLQLNNGAITTYDGLYDVTSEDVTYDNGQTTIRETKQLLTGTLNGNESITNNFRMWISGESTEIDAGKVFRTKVKVFAGQGLPEPEYAITPEECFDFENGVITGYHFNDENCSKNNVVFPATIDGSIVTNIGNDLISGYGNNINKIDISKMTGLKKIGNSAFANVKGISVNGFELVIPEGVTEIGNNAFEHYDEYYNNEDWTNTTNKLVLPNSLEKIGAAAFRNYGGLNADRLVIPNKVTRIENDTFARFKGAAISLPSNLEYIGPRAFSAYQGTELILPNTITEIGNSAFFSYNGSSLILPSSLTILRNDAFSNYNGSDVTIPHGVTEIGNFVFKSMDSNKKIIFEMTRAEYANVTKGSLWKGSAQIYCIENNTEVLCES